MPRILLVEDHAPLAATIAEGLAGAGYEAEVVGDGAAALARVAERHFDILLLDWMLPHLDGMKVLNRLRRDGFDVPIVLLTARDAVEDRVRGLDAGADDYIIKPFAFDELLARLRMVLRRRAGGGGRVLEIGDLRIDTAARTVHRGPREIPLSSREYAVLECMALNRGRVVSRERLLMHAYGDDTEPESNVIEVYIAHLRRKIDRDGGRKLIHTRRGMGYILGPSE